MATRVTLSILLGTLLLPKEICAETNIVSKTFPRWRLFGHVLLHLTKEDIPIGIGVIAMLGGGTALDRLTCRNLFSH